MYSISVNEKAYLETSSNSHILFCVHTDLSSLTHNSGENSCQHPLRSWNAAGCVLGAGQRGAAAPRAGSLRGAGASACPGGPGTALHPCKQSRTAAPLPLRSSLTELSVFPGCSLVTDLSSATCSWLVC